MASHQNGKDKKKANDDVNKKRVRKITGQNKIKYLNLYKIQRN